MRMQVRLRTMLPPVHKTHRRFFRKLFNGPHASIDRLKKRLRFFRTQIAQLLCMPNGHDHEMAMLNRFNIHDHDYALIPVNNPMRLVQSLAKNAIHIYTFAPWHFLNFFPEPQGH